MHVNASQSAFQKDEAYFSEEAFLDELAEDGEKASTSIDPPRFLKPVKSN